MRPPQETEPIRARLIALAAFAALTQAHAQPVQPPMQPPMPPPRPATIDERQPPAQEPRAAARDEQASSPQQAAPQTPQQAAPVETPRPFDREAMRACAEEWARMKRTGATRNVVWRDFAAGCLPRFGERQR